MFGVRPIVALEQAELREDPALNLTLRPAILTGVVHGLPQSVQLGVSISKTGR
jgi:hypothetical protein